MQKSVLSVIKHCTAIYLQMTFECSFKQNSVISTADLCVLNLIEHLHLHINLMRSFTGALPVKQFERGCETALLGMFCLRNHHGCDGTNQKLNMTRWCEGGSVFVCVGGL